MFLLLSIFLAGYFISICHGDINQVIHVVPRVFDSVGSGEPWEINDVNSQCWRDPILEENHWNVSVKTPIDDGSFKFTNHFSVMDFITTEASDIPLETLLNDNDTRLTGVEILVTKIGTGNTIVADFDAIILMQLNAGYEASRDQSDRGVWPKTFKTLSYGGKFFLWGFQESEWVDNLKNNRTQFRMEAMYQSGEEHTISIACIEMLLYVTTPTPPSTSPTQSPTESPTPVVTTTLIPSTTPNMETNDLNSSTSLRMEDNSALIISIITSFVLFCCLVCTIVALAYFMVSHRNANRSITLSTPQGDVPRLHTPVNPSPSGMPGSIPSMNVEYDIVPDGSPNPSHYDIIAIQSSGLHSNARNALISPPGVDVYDQADSSIQSNRAYDVVQTNRECNKSKGNDQSDLDMSGSAMIIEYPHEQIGDQKRDENDGYVAIPV